MAIKFYLAMMAEEISDFPDLPENSAFIYHIYPDIFQEIPMSGIAVLTDFFPVQPDLAQSVAQWIRQWSCEAVVLDFQNPKYEEAEGFVRLLQTYVSCPVVVSEIYAAQMDCPVFLPPLPHHKSLKDHLTPWQGREIWMDLSPLPEQLLLTQQGCSSHYDFSLPPCCPVHENAHLHCHYSITLEEGCAAFTFWRTDDDLTALLQELEEAGVHHAIGLHQEWTKKNRPGFPERF